MSTTKKFLDEAGLIQILQEIEALDKTNIKDLYWSTDNADTYPTIVYKIGDTNGQPSTIKKITFKGDTATIPTGANSRNITLTIGGIDKTITYYDTNDASGITYTVNDNTTTLKATLDNVINVLNGLQEELTFDNTPTIGSLNPVTSDGIKTAVDAAAKTVRQTSASGNISNPVLLGGTNEIDEVKYAQDIQYTPSTRTTNIHTNGKTTGTSMTFSFHDGALHISTATIDDTSYTGRATGTETLLTTNNALGSNGAAMIGYWDNSSDIATTVEEALNELRSDVDHSVNTYATKAALEALTNRLTSAFQIVSTLPTADGTHGGIIYLIKDQEYGDTNSNIFKEYVEVNDGTTSTPNWKFELLGTTDAGVDVVTIPVTGTNSVASMFAQYVTNA